MADDIFVVEKILDKHILSDGQVEYLIKWFGYDEEDATWEPLENIFCTDLLEKYEADLRLSQENADINYNCQQILNEICKQLESVQPTTQLEDACVSQRKLSTDCSISTVNDDDVANSKNSNSNERLHINFDNQNENLTSTKDDNRLISSDNSETKLGMVQSFNNKDMRSDNGIDEDDINIDTDKIDYMSLGPERIISITRSRTPSHDLEFLLKCKRYPTKLFFIPNEIAKELIPELIIDFYERHINWFVDKSLSSIRRNL